MATIEAVVIRKLVLLAVALALALSTMACAAGAGPVGSHGVDYGPSFNANEGGALACS